MRKIQIWKRMEED